MKLDHGDRRRGDQNGATVALLGARLRAARTARGRTLASVAEQAGVTPSFLSQIERGLCSPSVSSLLTIAGCLNVEVVELFAGVAGGDSVVRADERSSVAVAPGMRFSHLASSPDGRCEMGEVVIEPGGVSQAHPNRHAGRETGYVTQGEAFVELDGARHVLRVGDSIAFPSSVPHLLGNDGPGPCRLVWFSYMPAPHPLAEG